MFDEARMRAVVVEGDADRRRRVREGLAAESDRLAVEAVAGPDDCEETLTADDCVVTGLDPTGEDPAAFAEQFAGEDAPALVLFADADAATARAALEAGYDAHVQDTGTEAAFVALADRVEEVIAVPGTTSVEAMLAETMAAVNRASRALLRAESTEAVAAAMADVAAEVLDFPGTGVRLYNPERETLDHVTFGDRIEDIDRRPPYDVHGTPHGDAFLSGETRIDDIGDEDPYDREVFSQTMYVPLADYGLLSVGIVEGEFTDAEVRLTELVAETAVIGFEMAEQGERLLAVERELERQNERLDRFAAIVSHDVRNPLQVALGRLDAIEQSVPDDHAAKFRAALERMERVVEDVLVLTRKGQRIEKLQRVSLDSLCWSSWRSVETADATLAVLTDATVLTDRERLDVALEHLFRNAVQHGGADVTVSVGRTDDGFFVEDDGVGLGRDDVETLFEATATTERDGSGLGLVIVREIAEAHDWTVRATTGKRGGLRVEFGNVTVESE